MYKEVFGDRQTDIEYDYEKCINIMLETGVVPHSQALFMAIRGENVSRCQLLVEYGGNPFLHEPDDTE